MSNAHQDRIGLIADSHNKVSLMVDAIAYLREQGAVHIIHLGDICDSLEPEKLDEAVEILEREGITAVRGNNECVVINEYLPSHTGHLKKSTLTFLDQLPYVLRFEEFFFTHSAPFEWPEATRRPIRYYLPRLLETGRAPFRILFRGHSHRPSIIEIDKTDVRKIRIEPNESAQLDRKKTYVITVGAVEKSTCALFDPLVYTIKSLDFSHR